LEFFIGICGPSYKCGVYRCLIGRSGLFKNWNSGHLPGKHPNM
jgi:hypothetical protein